MINVDTVYKTVLLILNKEQRGIMTPDEFNKTATKVQLDIFETYFSDYSTLLTKSSRAHGEYYEKVKRIEDKLAPFRAYGECVYTAAGFEVPVTTEAGESVVNNSSPSFGSGDLVFYTLGDVEYVSPEGYSVDIQPVTRGEYNNLQRSDLTKASMLTPVYLEESGKLVVAPSNITSNVYAAFMVKPKDVKWDFIVGSRGEYLFGGSPEHFQLHVSEQVNVINRILFYSGVVIKDPQVVQAAAQQIQQDEINKKS